MEEAIESKISRRFSKLPPTSKITIQSQKYAIIDGARSESLLDVVTAVCQLATIRVLKNHANDPIIVRAFDFELANNKGVIVTSIQDSNILKLYEAMRFILGHIEINFAGELRTSVKKILVDFSSEKVVLTEDFSDFCCLQLLTYSSEILPHVTVNYTNDEQWFTRAGVIGRNIYAHQQWTRFKERAELWRDCFHWTGIDSDGMSTFGNTQFYEGNVVSWNGTGVPEQVFQTNSSLKPFANFICARASFIAKQLGREHVFTPTEVCIL